MELTPEEKQRIEEEEQKRLAEEEYRTQVRSRLKNGSVVPPLSASSPGYVLPEPEGVSKGWWILGLVVAGIVGVIIWVNVSRSSKADPDPSAARSISTPAAPRIRYVPVSQKIATGQIAVKAGGYVQYRIRIEPEMREARVTGSFNASGGSGNDIEVVIAGENEYTNWINGHEARVFYGTHGKKTTDSFDVRLAPGEYYLAFSNKFSTFTDKYVFLEVDLKYSRAETY
jgi:hypothetical protein